MIFLSIENGPLSIVRPSYKTQIILYVRFYSTHQTRMNRLAQFIQSIHISLSVIDNELFLRSYIEVREVSRFGQYQVWWIMVLNTVDILTFFFKLRLAKYFYLWWHVISGIFRISKHSRPGHIFGLKNWHPSGSYWINELTWKIIFTDWKVHHIK